MPRRAEWIGATKTARPNYRLGKLPVLERNLWKLQVEPLEGLIRLFLDS